MTVTRLCQARRFLLANNPTMCGRPARYEVKEGAGLREAAIGAVCAECFDLMAEGVELIEWRRLGQTTWHAGSSAQFGERL